MDRTVWLAAAVIYLAAVNITAFILYGADKKKAKRGQWRIPEKTLLGVAVIGGSAGAILGMFLFRHKTKHWYFRYGLPAILIVQLVLVYVLSGRLL
ncbi:MAG: DUF1294 domain-containing protein [Lachnospiraceae bacterium]|nr:DUF1294 domain-containing protein [Lachnospiraceae bacterium]